MCIVIFCDFTSSKVYTFTHTLVIRVTFRTLVIVCLMTHRTVMPLVLGDVIIVGVSEKMIYSGMKRNAFFCFMITKK